MELTQLPPQVAAAVTRWRNGGRLGGCGSSGCRGAVHSTGLFSGERLRTRPPLCDHHGRLPSCVASRAEV